MKLVLIYNLKKVIMLLVKELNYVNHVKPQESDPPKEPKKEILCKICLKKHTRTQI